MTYNQSNTEDFIEKARKIHGDDYDYSKVNYVNAYTKVCIICHKKDKDGNEHGEFWVAPTSHLSKKVHRCPKCSKKFMDKDFFIKKAREIHGDKYDYSKVEYVNQKTPVCIICPEHGEFWQIPTGHIDKKAGCPKCSGNHRYTTEEFIESLPDWIRNKYDFSKFVYRRTHDKSILICKEHGEFSISPHNIRKGIGCPACSESKLEREIRLLLKESGIKFISEYKHNNDFHKQAIDFYLPDHNIGIECQGIQHFFPTDFAGKGKEWAENEFLHITELDKNKQTLCRENGIKLIYFTTKENIKDYDIESSHYKGFPIYTDINDILNNLDT